MRKNIKEKNLLKENILLSQSRLNFNTSEYSKYFQSNTRKRNENERSFDSFSKEDLRQKDLADIQKQQIYLKHLDQQNDLFNTRLIEDEHQKTCKKKFPYGIQNVEVSEDVLNRYRGRSYLDQSEILQKFRKEAEQAKKRIKNQRKRIIDKPEKKILISPIAQAPILKRVQFQQQREEDRRSQKEMRNIAKMMKKLSNQLNQNSYTLDRSLQDLKNSIEKKKEKKKKKITLPQLKRAEYDQFQQQKFKKIPIVVYEGRPFDARVYFSDVYKKTPSVMYNEISSRSDHNDEMINILKANKRRLNELERIDEVNIKYI